MINASLVARLLIFTFLLYFQRLPVIILAAVDEGSVTLALVHVEVGQYDLVHHLSHKHHQRQNLSHRAKPKVFIAGFSFAIFRWSRYTTRLKKTIEHSRDPPPALYETSTSRCVESWAWRYTRLLCTTTSTSRKQGGRGKSSLNKIPLCFVIWKTLFALYSRSRTIYTTKLMLLETNCLQECYVSNHMTPLSPSSPVNRFCVLMGDRNK